MRRGEATLGLRYFGDPSPDLVSRDIGHEPLIVVARSGHRLARARRIPAQRLAGEAWVGFPPRRGAVPDPFGHVLARRLAAAGLDEAEVVVIDSLTAQKRLVESGFGLALVPVTSVGEEIARGSLCALDVPELGAQVDIVLIHRKRAFLGPAARRLIEELAVGARPRRRTMASRGQVR